MMRNKVSALLLAGIMLLTAIPLNASAKEAEETETGVITEWCEHRYEASEKAMQYFQGIWRPAGWESDDPKMDGGIIWNIGKVLPQVAVSERPSCFPKDDMSV